MVFLVHREIKDCGCVILRKAGGIRRSSQKAGLPDSDNGHAKQPTARSSMIQAVVESTSRGFHGRTRCLETSDLPCHHAPIRVEGQGLSPPPSRLPLKIECPGRFCRSSPHRRTSRRGPRIGTDVCRPCEDFSWSISRRMLDDTWTKSTQHTGLSAPATEIASSLRWNKG